MTHVASHDGTRIAFDRRGEGPPLILVEGALTTRTSGIGARLAPLLAGEFSVYTYDRRGRGDSGDMSPYAVEREIEDLDALIKDAVGPAFAFGISSGAALALEAASSGLAISRLALYEAPFIIDDTRPPVGDDYLERLEALVEAGKHGAAVRLFMAEGARVPAVFVAMMRFMPAWPRLKALAPTLIYDTTIIADRLKGRGLSAETWRSASMPTLVANGGKSPLWMRNAMKELADALPNAEYRTLTGQTHMVKATALQPTLSEFFGSPRPPADGPAMVEALA